MRAVATCLPALACALVIGGVTPVARQGDPELGRVYLGSGSFMPSVVSRVLPGYPTKATFSGDIDVEAVVSTKGTVIHAWALPAAPDVEVFRSASLLAAQNWVFRPAGGDGRAVPVLVVLRMNFKAARGSAPPEVGARLLPVRAAPPRAELPAVVYQSVPPSSGFTLIRSVRPQYTSQARERSLQGAVTLNILVMPDGRVGDATVAKSLDRQYGLDEQAILAARYWLFQPAIVDGRPVAFRTTLELEFRLKADSLFVRHHVSER